MAGISVAADSDVWTRNDVQAVSAINMIVNVKILFIFSFFLLFQIFEILLLQDFEQPSHFPLKPVLGRFCKTILNLNLILLDAIVDF